MSLILDALRKSEAERRRGQTPDLHSPGPVMPRPLRHGGPGTTAFVAVAVLLVATVAWLVFAPEATVAPPTPDEVAPTQETVANDRTDTPAPAPVPAPAIPAQAPKPMPMSPPPVASAPPATTTVVKPATVPAQKPVAETTPPAPPVAVAVAAVTEPALPGIAILPVEQRSALPPLKISMHVWSEQPAERFAIIDGQRVGEGARVPGGLVAEIRRDGVVLDVAGRLYLIPRP